MKKLLVLILCVCGLTAYAQEKQGPFQFEPSVVMAGQTVTLSYNSALTPLAGSQTITGVIYLCDGDDWRADDLNMVKRDSVWVATYQVPEKCVLLACKFYGDNGEWDSGPLMGQYGVFVSKLVDGEAKSQQGAYIHWGLLRSKSFDYFAVPGFSKEDAQIDDNVLQMWVGYEYRFFPESRETLSYYAAKNLNKNGSGEQNHLFEQDIEYILGLEAPAELSLIRVAEIYKDMMKNEEKAKEVEALILERFPDGILARDKAIWAVYMEREPEAKLQLLEDMLRRFPQEKFPVPQTDLSRSFYGRIFWSSMQDRIVNKKDYKLLHELLPFVPYSALAEYYYRVVQLQLKHGMVTYEQVRPHADAIWAEIQKRAERGEDRYYNSRARFSPRQWREQVKWDTRGYAITHGKVLYETGAYAEGLEVMESVKDFFGGKVSDFNETYAQLLAANGYDQLVIPFLESSIAHDAATPEMIATLEKDFRKKNPSGDFEVYLNGLRSADHVAEFEQHLLASLIDQDIEPFVLEDMNGKTVDMSKLKGKVIVLDFWATWCSPCKAAMPGMKMAVERYAENPDVAFYFISTCENDKNFKTTVPKFIKEKNYPFEVLYDVSPDGKGNGLYYNKYKINGIPHKMIIDQKGKLRWSSNGYFGNPLELANEISFLVDYLLKEENR